MSRKRYKPEQIIGMLREAEVELSRGQKVGQVRRWTMVILNPLMGACAMNA